MKEQRIMIDLPRELWRKVGAAASMAGLTKKEYVANSLTAAVMKDYNGGDSVEGMAQDSV